MRKIIFWWVITIIVTALIILAFRPKDAVADDVVQMEIHHPTTTSELITYFAERYNVSETTMRRKIKCESGFNTNAVNHTSIEYSVGLSQINLWAHPEVSVEQAKNPIFAVRFMAEHLARGQDIWSCK